ncbi:MAG: cytidine deaminase [Candidatus Njordarchaeota archaeon]
MEKNCRNEDISELLKIARDKLKYCYSPYSNIRVISVLKTDGGLYYGVNIENASYGLTICAERVAIFKAISEGQKNFQCILVYSPDVKPIPCGACLQVIREFSSPDLPIIIAFGNKPIQIEKYLLKDLLPVTFSIKS